MFCPVEPIHLLQYFVRLVLETLAIMSASNDMMYKHITYSQKPVYVELML